MIDWWNGLSIASQIFTCIAVPASLILLIQTIMMFMGIGDDMDGMDIDGGDIGEADDIDGVFGDNEVPEDADPSGFDGLRVFTMRGIIAFLVVFGWLGMALDSAGVELYISIPVAFAAGFAMMLLLALIFRAVLKLRNDGNTDNRNAIGVSCKVHLTIPPSRTGEGKVHLMLQGSYVERGAVTDEETAIPTGSEVVVVGVSGQTDLVVRRK